MIPITVNGQLTFVSDFIQTGMALRKELGLLEGEALYIRDSRGGVQLVVRRGLIHVEPNSVFEFHSDRQG